MNETPEKLKELLEKHKQDVILRNYDPIYEDAYNYGGIYFVEKLIEILKKTNIYDTLESQMFIEINGKIYKRLN